MSNTLYEVGFSKNDFYYLTAGYGPLGSSTWKPDDNNCNVPAITNLTDDSCKENAVGSFLDNSLNCMRQQICENKKKSDSIESIIYSHLGSEENYNDSQKIYKEQYKKIINNGLSIIFVIFLIFYSNK